MEPELNREASSSTPEWPNQAAPVFDDDDTYLDSEQITTPPRPASPQHQPLPNQQLDQKLAEQRERQLEQQLREVRNELAAMESLMAEVTQIFALKYQQRLQPILEENNGLRQQLDQVHRQLHQLQPQQRQAQPYHIQPAKLAQKQPLQPAQPAQSQPAQPAQLAQNQPTQPAQSQQPQLPQVERPQRQRPQLQPAQSKATQASRSKANTARANTTNLHGEKLSEINADNGKEASEATNNKKSGGENEGTKNLDKENIVTTLSRRPRRNGRIRPAKRIGQISRIIRPRWIRFIQSIRRIISINKIRRLRLPR